MSEGWFNSCDKKWFNCIIKAIFNFFSRLTLRTNFSLVTLLIFLSTPTLAQDLFGYPIGESCKYFQAPAKDLVTLKGSSLRLRKEAYRAWLLLKQQAIQQNIYLSISYAYRALSAQRQLYNKLGPTQAEKAGYSEHHLGTAVDLVGVTSRSKTFRWLLKYAIPLGWVPSYYYRSKSRFIKEPWHWRYVGKTAAKRFYETWKLVISQSLENLPKPRKFKKPFKKSWEYRGGKREVSSSPRNPLYAKERH